MRLCLALGIFDWEIVERAGDRLLRRWEAFELFEPLPDRRDDQRTGLLAQSIDRGRSGVRADWFDLSARPAEPPPSQDPDVMRAKLADILYMQYGDPDEA